MSISGSISIVLDKYFKDLIDEEFGYENSLDPHFLKTLNPYFLERFLHADNGPAFRPKNKPLPKQKESNIVKYKGTYNHFALEGEFQFYWWGYKIKLEKPIETHLGVNWKIDTSIYRTRQHIEELADKCFQEVAKIIAYIDANTIFCQALYDYKQQENFRDQRSDRLNTL